MAKTPRVLGHASDKLRSDKDYMLLGTERQEIRGVETRCNSKKFIFFDE